MGVTKQYPWQLKASRAWPIVRGQEIRPFDTRSALPTPSPEHILLLYRAYLDDSGAPSGGHSFLTIAGYAATVESWREFEGRWAQTLRAYGVPYLHMKEFGRVDSGIYAALKADKQREADFLATLRDIIYDHVEFCAHATVALGDLAQFNQERGLDIDPYALALYACHLEFESEFKFDECEVVTDGFDRAGRRCELARQYVQSDKKRPTAFEPFFMCPLRGHDSFKNTLPIQAADLVAWEMRKSWEDHKRELYT